MGIKIFEQKMTVTSSASKTVLAYFLTATSLVASLFLHLPAKSQSVRNEIQELEQQKRSLRSKIEAENTGILSRAETCYRINLADLADGAGVRMMYVCPLRENGNFALFGSWKGRYGHLNSYNVQDDMGKEVMSVTPLQDGFKMTFYQDDGGMRMRTLSATAECFYNEKSNILGDTTCYVKSSFQGREVGPYDKLGKIYIARETPESVRSSVMYQFRDEL